MKPNKNQLLNAFEKLTNAQKCLIEPTGNLKTDRYVVKAFNDLETTISKFRKYSAKVLKNEKRSYTRVTEA